MKDCQSANFVVIERAISAWRNGYLPELVQMQI